MSSAAREWTMRSPRRPHAISGVVVAVAVVAVLVAPASRGSAARPNVMAYRGLGSWVDIYDCDLWARPRETVRAMHALGVRTLFLETANFRAKDAIFRPRMTDRFIHEAHRLGMRVVAWYLPGFDDLDRDVRRSMAAIQYVTSGGQRFDSFGLDIESSQVRDPALRTARMLRLSRRIRDAVGSTYPLGAIIPSPRGMELLPTYWPNFPFAELASIYDVFVPMGYFSYRTSGEAGAHDYTRRNIRIIREETGNPALPIHVIGGIADGVTGEEARGFVRAAREHGVLGASLYDFDTSGPEDWGQLALVPVNPRQPVALPVPIGYLDPLGNVPEVDTRHPKEVFYRSGGRSGAWAVRFEVFDVQAGEVELWVNWRRVAILGHTAQGVWSRPRSVTLLDEWVRDRGTNFIHFAARGDYPNWSRWGVRAVTLVPAGG